MKVMKRVEAYSDFEHLWVLLSESNSNNYGFDSEHLQYFYRKSTVCQCNGHSRMSLGVENVGVNVYL